MEDPGRLRRMLIVGKDGPQGHRNPWRLTIVGIVGAALLLGLVILIDSGRPQGKEEDDAPSAEITELIGPSRLNEEETATGGMLDPNIGLNLPSGGWVQVADEEGNLAQQYRCEHLDPDPPEYPAHWIDMIKPKVELYLSGDRLLTITGDRAVAYAPSRALDTLNTPLVGGRLKDLEVRRLQMVLKGRLVLVNLIQPYSVVVLGILDCIEPQAPWLIVVGALGVYDQGL